MSAGLRPDGLPRWLSATVEVALCAVLAFALAAMPLAMAGVLHPWVALVATLLLAAGLAALLFGERLAVARPRGRWAVACALGALALALASGVLNAHYSSQHVVADRDPGVYLWFGRWLADHGSLLLDNPIHLFAAARGSFVAQCPETCVGAPGGHLYVQFLHLPAAVLAAGAWIGGNSLMVEVDAILGALSLLVFYAFATRLLRAQFALLATVALAVNLVQVYFSRDAWSEILVQLLLFGGLFELHGAHRAWSARRAAVAGLLLGACCMARIDSFFFLIPLAAYTIGEYGLAGPSHERRRFAVALAGGAALTAALGAIDLFFFSRGYYRLQSHQMHAIAAGLALVVLAGVGLLLGERRGLGWGSRLRDLAARAASVAALLVVAIALLAWFVRPLVVHGHGPPSMILRGLQRSAGLPLDPGRTYVEDSMRWLSWYLGPVALAAGLLGFAAALRDALRGRLAPAVPFLAIFGLLTALYVLQPSIFPDQIVAMRRFLPVTIPGSLLCASWAVQRALDALAGRPAVLRAGAVTALAAGIVAIPAQQTARLIDVREQAGGLRAMATVCASLPPHAVVWTIAGVVESGLIEPLHAFCKVPVAQAPGHLRRAKIDAFAADLAAHGRRLVLVSNSRLALRALLGAAAPPAPVAVLSYKHLEQTLTRRPSAQRPAHIAFWVAVL